MSSKKLEDLVGQQFGNWIILSEGTTSFPICECQCESKTQRKLSRRKLLLGKTKSCGCSMLSNLKDTCLSKYGVTCNLRSEQALEKTKQTSLDKYGTEFPQASEQAKEVRKDTCMELYGVDNILKIPSIHAQSRDTMEKVYGVRSSGAFPEVIEKKKKTHLERYGVDCMYKSPEWRNQHCNTFSSKAELDLLSFVQQFYPTAKSKQIKGHQIDIYIEEIKLCIEYNGIYWHGETGRKPKDRNYHINKKNNIKNELDARTIMIWEHEWRDSRNQVENFLKGAMGISVMKLGARNCEFKSIPCKVANEFVKANHIQGCNAASSLAIGCYYDNELIAVSTFGKHHRTGIEYILNRFVCRTGFHIAGCLSKMSKLASSLLDSDLVSWADLCKSEGNGYIKSGWILEEILPPDYFYGTHGNKVVSKHSRMKSVVNTPEGMTEAEHAELDGLFKVWDCGKIRFRFPKK